MVVRISRMAVQPPIEKQVTERVTSLQVAKGAGVSQSAVSRVFTPGASVSEGTREKVLRAANELGYRPNVLARAMITGKSKIIGLVVAYLENQFYPLAVEKLSVALQAEGYHVLVFMASNTSENIQSVMKEILDYQVDGIVLASVSMSSDLAARCQDHGIPVILFNREQDDDRLCSITTDNYQGGVEIGKHFAASHYERIGYIAGFEGASTQRDREQGFRDALEDNGLTLASRTIGAFDQERTRAAAMDMFNQSGHPDTVFVCNDHMAFIVMDVIRFELKLRIPEDVSIAGFDDVPIAAWPAYNLTSYRQPINRMVSRTVSTLLTRIADASMVADTVKLKGQLILRGSTRSVSG